MKRAHAAVPQRRAPDHWERATGACSPQTRRRTRGRRRELVAFGGGGAAGRHDRGVGGVARRGRGSREGHVPGARARRRRGGRAQNRAGAPARLSRGRRATPASVWLRCARGASTGCGGGGARTSGRGVRRRRRRKSKSRGPFGGSPRRAFETFATFAVRIGPRDRARRRLERRRRRRGRRRRSRKPKSSLRRISGRTCAPPPPVLPRRGRGPRSLRRRARGWRRKRLPFRAPPHEHADALQPCRRCAARTSRSVTRHTELPVRGRARRAAARVPAYVDALTGGR